jgi:hypothetical protein
VAGIHIHQTGQPEEHSMNGLSRRITHGSIGTGAPICGPVRLFGRTPAEPTGELNSPCGESSRFASTGPIPSTEGVYMDQPHPEATYIDNNHWRIGLRLARLLADGCLPRPGYERLVAVFGRHFWLKQTIVQQAPVWCLHGPTDWWLNGTIATLGGRPQ